MKGKGRKAHRKLRQRPYENLVKSYGLLDIEKYARLKTLAKAEWRILSVSPVRENFMHGLMKAAMDADSSILLYLYKIRAIRLYST